MFRTTFLMSLPLMLTSCQLAGPFVHIGGIATEGGPAQLILVRHWDWQFTYHDKRHRSEYYVVNVLEGDPAAVTPARPLFATGTSEQAEFIKVAGTDRWAALVKSADEQRLTVWVTQPTDQPTNRGAVKIVELDLEEDAYAITRSGHHLLTVRDDGLLIRNLVDGGIVEQRRDDPLVSLRNEILSRFDDGGPGQWWLTDDLRHVAFVPPWTFEDGSPVESMPVTLFGVSLDLSNDGLVYDRAGGGFRRLHRMVTVGVLRDVETIEGDVLLLYGDSHPIANRLSMAVVDLDLNVRRQVELAASFRLGERSLQWVPRADQVKLVGTEEHSAIATRPGPRGGTVTMISPAGRTVHLHTWNEQGQVIHLEVPWQTIENALPVD